MPAGIETFNADGSPRFTMDRKPGLLLAIHRVNGVTLPIGGGTSIPRRPFGPIGAYEGGAVAGYYLAFAPDVISSPDWQNVMFPAFFLSGGAIQGFWPIVANTGVAVGSFTDIGGTLYEMAF